MCCGRRRTAQRYALGSVQAAPPASAPAGVSSATPVSDTQTTASVLLRYVENAPIRVWGPVTRRPYDFSGAEPTRDVEARDAAVLARSRFFRRA